MTVLFLVSVWLIQAHPAINTATYSSVLQLLTEHTLQLTVTNELQISDSSSKNKTSAMTLHITAPCKVRVCVCTRASLGRELKVIHIGW